MKRRPAKAPTSPDKLYEIGKCLLIALAVTVCYLPALHAGFVWDDEPLITANPLLRNLSGLGEIWSGSRTADYFPVTNTVFWIEAHLFGQNAAGYHMVNVLLQAINAVLVWRVLRRLGIPGAFLAGLIFGIHPVHVESVAWISELKNVLSMFFYLVSILCFFEAEDRKGSRDRLLYVWSLISFVLALLSKTQVVFLPFILLLCLWYRSRQIQGNETRTRKPSENRKRSFRQTIGRVLPYFLIALALGLITIWFQNRGIGEEEILLGSPSRRLVNAGIAVWWYAKQVFVPFPLMVIYRAWRFGSPGFTDWLPVACLIALVLFLWRFRNRGGAPFFLALSCFIVALLPVVGLVRMAYVRSGTLVADHLQYFADISLIAFACAGLVQLQSSPRRMIRIFATAVIVFVIGALGADSFARASVFRDEETLWHDNLSRNPNAWQAHNRLGELYFGHDQFAEAAGHFERAAALKPELAGNHNLLGLAYCRLEKFEQGITEYRTALRLKEQNPSTANTAATATIRTNLANALTITANNLSERRKTQTGRSPDNSDAKEAMDRYREAISEYEKALEIEPEQPAIHRNLALVLVRLGRTSDAIVHLHKVLQFAPNEPVAREMLDTLGDRDR